MDILPRILKSAAEPFWVFATGSVIMVVATASDLV
jgi:hypothetical protein